MSYKYFNLFRNMFNSKTVKINNVNVLTYKAIQCVLTSGYSSRLFTYVPYFTVLGELSLEKTPLNPGSFR